MGKKICEKASDRKGNMNGQQTYDITLKFLSNKNKNSKRYH